MRFFALGAAVATTTTKMMSRIFSVCMCEAAYIFIVQVVDTVCVHSCVPAYAYTYIVQMQWMFCILIPFALARLKIFWFFSFLFRIKQIKSVVRQCADGKCIAQKKKKNEHCKLCAHRVYIWRLYEWSNTSHMHVGRSTATAAASKIERTRKIMVFFFFSHFLCCCCCCCCCSWCYEHEEPVEMC